MNLALTDEQHFLVRLLSGELRQGALDGVMTDAVARAAGVPAGRRGTPALTVPNYVPC